MSDYFTGCEVCEANARTYGVMTAECKVDELEAQVAELKARIAELEKDNGIYQDANIRLTKEFEQERATLTRKNRALKHELRKLHRAREQDWEAGKRWRKEFLEFSERLLSERREAERRIAELEAAAQWRPMDTAPRDGTPILAITKTYRIYRIAYYFVLWEGGTWTDEDGHDRDAKGFIGWLPIPALPEGGV